MGLTLTLDYLIDFIFTMDYFVELWFIFLYTIIGEPLLKYEPQFCSGQLVWAQVTICGLFVVRVWFSLIEYFW